jgi:hypothetical protein
MRATGLSPAGSALVDGKMERHCSVDQSDTGSSGGGCGHRQCTRCSSGDEGTLGLS